MTKQLTTVFLLCTMVLNSTVFAQWQMSADGYKAQNNKAKPHKVSMKQTSHLNNYDVKFYYLDIALERTSVDISGNVAIMAEVKSAVLDTFAFELIDILTVDSVLINGINCNFIRSNDEVFVKCNPALNQGEFLTARIFYHGTPPSGGFFTGITNDNSPTWGNQITWTLSEPFNAKQWFPCKQVLTDKADSVYVFVTTSNDNKVGSNGLLYDIVALPNNKVRYEWKSYYPINYYLISVAVGEYIDYSFYAHPAGLNDSILVQNYIYDNPATLNYFKTQIDLTDDFIELFSELYGLYPFWKEKYGHSMAPLGGGMEHQTMTTLGSFNFTLTSHELSHQWFGDNVTCATWSDIWINEGFASYSEYLALEHLNPGNQFNWMADAHNLVMSEPDGSVYVPLAQANDENRIFSGRLSYKKGASIVHMLRVELQNDSLFFEILKNFQITYKDSVATGDDFKAVAENLSGKNLDYFFDQWYYGEGYPIYNTVWLQFNDSLIISNTQTTSTTITPFFKMLIPFKIYTSQGDTVVFLEQNQSAEIFKVHFTFPIDSISLDPDHHVLKLVDNIVQGNANINNKAENFLIYPNPVCDVIQIQCPFDDHYKIQIYDVKGALLKEYESDKSVSGINVSDLQKGFYLIQLSNSNRVFASKKFVKF